MEETIKVIHKNGDMPLKVDTLVVTDNLDWDGVSNHSCNIVHTVTEVLGQRAIAGEGIEVTYKAIRFIGVKR